jgi:hypothetical protein
MTSGACIGVSLCVARLARERVFGWLGKKSARRLRDDEGEAEDGVDASALSEECSCEDLLSDCDGTGVEPDDDDVDEADERNDASCCVLNCLR